MENTNNKKEIKISRIFNAPIKKVWEAWTMPQEIMKWWGPQDFTSPVCKVDLRVGGKYVFCMRGIAGPNQVVKDYWSGGIYKEIIPFEKIVCTDGFLNENGDSIDPIVYGMPSDFPKENEVIITFEDYLGKTKLTILYVTDSSAAYKAMIETQMKEGWESSLDKLVESLS